MKRKITLHPACLGAQLDAATILELAKQSDLASVVVLGWTESGDQFFSSSEADGVEVLWLLERAKFDLFSLCKAVEEGEV